MATSATKIYESYAEDHRLDPKECQRVCALPHFVRSAEESQALAREPGPMIVISASGMATGGRVLHHLAARLKDPKHTIAFVGYQAPGTRGADLVGGRREVKLFGQYFGVQAEVVKLDALSAHADQGEIIGWLKSARSAPRRIWLNHGEAASADALRRRIQDELGWSVEVPEEREAIDLWV